jgi:hypothetical protein
MYSFSGRPISSIALVLAITGTALVADGGANHRLSSDLYGVSGGNVNDRSRAFCCSGTLGSLVADGVGTRYILSNNHVLARSGAGETGEDVSQPGMIDNNCQVADIVADLAYAAPLGSSNVDAALAELRAGEMDAGGEIMDIGVPSGDTATPAVGMSVAKSGRTTGLTTGAVSSINTTVQVQYQQGCGSGKKFRVLYTNQVVINSSTFSAGGDSGSLIVRNTAAHEPVALLYAGSSTTTIGNPIDEVLLRLGSAAGKTFSFDLSGGGGGGNQARRRIESNLSAEEIERGSRAKDAHERRLMGDPSVLGVGVGEDEFAPGRAAVVVLVRRGAAASGLARQLDGVAVRIIETDEIVAYGWNEALGGSCKKVR